MTTNFKELLARVQEELVHAATSLADDIQVEQQPAGFDLHFPSGAFIRVHVTEVEISEMDENFELIREGMTLQQVADEFGITRQAVQQRLYKAGKSYYVTEGMEARRRAREEEKKRIREEKARERSRSPHMQGGRGEYFTYTVDQCLDIIRKVADANGGRHIPLRLDRFGSMVKALNLDYRVPSAPTIIKRFDGKWIDACKAAGIATNESVRDSYTRMTDEDIFDAVLEYTRYIRAESGNQYAVPVAAGYDAWQRMLKRETGEKRPSLAGIRLYRSWSDLVQEVLDHLYQEQQAPPSS